jgi:hypothetical protein
MVSLGTLPGASPSDAIYPAAMNAQRTLIFGSVGQLNAFVWTAPAGMLGTSGQPFVMVLPASAYGATG